MRRSIAPTVAFVLLCFGPGCGGSGAKGGASCPSPSKVCGGACVDLKTDDANCGACSNACPAGEVCSDGTCTVSCAAPLTECTDKGGKAMCVDTATDPVNCGTCGDACPAPANAVATCASGSCSYGCQPGFLDCDAQSGNGCETHVATDPTNCGGCDHACPGGPNEAPTCTGGTCGLTCASGYADCDKNAANGCEAKLATDPANCGTCGHTCPTGTNQVATCSGGSCGVTCRQGYADCDKNAANGCEANLATDIHACGSCQVDCTTLPHVATVSCGNGKCQIQSCAAGWGNCDGNPANGCETSLTSPAHCGACGRVCTGFLRVCSNGVCAP